MCRPKNPLKTASGERVARLAVLKPHENAPHFHIYLIVDILISRCYNIKMENKNII